MSRPHMLVARMFPSSFRSPMIDIVLLEPEIPPNTGNIIRLCANTGFALHLIEPLGFELDEPRLRRAGLDYHEWAVVRVYESLDNYIEAISPRRMFAFSAKAATDFCQPNYKAGDALLFGPETRGLPPGVIERFGPEHRLRIPMRKEARSLNLSNAVAVAAYEAWRQLNYSGAAPAGQR